jgi:cytochrome c
MDLAERQPRLHGPAALATNNGAGMNRLIAAANFVHTNMPAGTDYLAPRLAPDDAWDVAAFMVSQPRPQRTGPRQGFPGSPEQAGRYALWAVCRQLRRTAAQIRAVRADPRNVGAAQGGNTGGPDAIRAGPADTR